MFDTDLAIIAVRDEATEGADLVKEVVGDVAFVPAILEGFRARCFRDSECDASGIIEAAKAASLCRVRLFNISGLPIPLASSFHALDEPISNYASTKSLIGLTYDIRLYGAGAAACSPALDKLLEFYGTGKLYIVFTSMHECIIHPAIDWLTVSDISCALAEAQFESMALSACLPEEFLTGNVYEYDSENGLALARV